MPPTKGISNNSNQSSLSKSRQRNESKKFGSAVGMISDYIDVNAPKHLITDRKLVGANSSKHGKNAMAAQGSTFIRRQGGMTQTMANNFLNQSQDS